MDSDEFTEYLERVGLGREKDDSDLEMDLDFSKEIGAKSINFGCLIIYVFLRISNFLQNKNLRNLNLKRQKPITLLNLLIL